MITRLVESSDHREWLAMRMELWPDTDESRHRSEMEMMRSDPTRRAVFVCVDEGGTVLGFAEVSLREWAEGCLSSPVGYLEGWFVRAQARGMGVGRKLLAASELWAKLLGCTEMASDTDLDNQESQAAHGKLGFETVGRVVAFRKALED